MKTSKNILTMGIICSLFLTACSSGTQNQEATEEKNDSMTEEVTKESMKVNTENSTVNWTGEMLGMYSHSGIISLKEGEIEVAGDKIKGGTFVVDMSTIKPTDENYDPSKDRTKEKLIGHLSSPDFFDVANHPTASFEITGSGENTVTGKLTIRGITNEETIENVKYDPATGIYSGLLTFDRTKYNVNFSMTAQDMVLSDDIELNFNIAT